MSSVAAATDSKATLAGGCFWCLEAVFEQLVGVSAVESGYCGGTTVDPTYQEVCSGATNHAEVVQISFDPAQISYDDLLNVFFAVHDPTTLNRQGGDAGTQYRSAIFTHDDAQAAAAIAKIDELTRAKLFDSPIVTRIEPLATFYPAEQYHQRYFQLNPQQGYCAAVISPKVAKFRKQFADRLRK